MLILFVGDGTLVKWTDFRDPYRFRPQGEEIAVSLFLKCIAPVCHFYVDRLKTISLMSINKNTG
jgi:hypothetical protein